MTIDLRTFDVLDSTNGECHRIMAAGYEGNLWVRAHQQTAGKGRRGREWVSRTGNLFASLLYAIDCDLATASQLSFVTALAVRDVVADVLGIDEPVRCKWPNDILVGGKKISGILLETAGPGDDAPSHVIIGIGINLCYHPDNTPYPATNLKDEGAGEIADVMDRLMSSMSHWITQWQDKGFAVICKNWKDKAYGMGQEVIVALPDGELKGRFVDLDETGALILEFQGERRHITAGDVFFP